MLRAPQALKSSLQQCHLGATSAKPYAPAARFFAETIQGGLVRSFFCFFPPFLFCLYSLSDKVTAPGGSFTWSFPPIAAGSVSFEIWAQLFSQIPDFCGNNYIRRKHTPRQINIKNVTSDLIYRRSFVVDTRVNNKDFHWFFLHKVYVCDFRSTCSCCCTGAPHAIMWQLYHVEISIEVMFVRWVFPAANNGSKRIKIQNQNYYC